MSMIHLHNDVTSCCALICKQSTDGKWEMEGWGGGGGSFLFFLFLSFHSIFLCTFSSVLIKEEINYVFF